LASLACLLLYQPFYEKIYFVGQARLQELML